MKLFRDLSCEEEFYARQLAALHFPGSRENSGTRNPVFLLQQMREAYSTESLEEAYPPEEGDQKVYMGNNTPVEFQYLFENDNTGEALRAEKSESGFSGKERLLHYLRFAENFE